MTLWQNLLVRWAIVKEAYKRGRHLTPQEMTDAGMTAIGADKLLYTAIGLLTVNWAQVEFCLDIINGILILHKNVKDKQLPIALQNKIRFLRKNFDLIPELAQHQDTKTKLLADVDRLRVIRHDIIHGVTFERLSGVVRQISRLKYQGKDLEVQHISYSTSHIIAAANDMRVLKDELLPLFWSVQGIMTSIFVSMLPPNAVQ